MTTPDIMVHPIRSQDTQVLRHRVLWPHKPSHEACVLPVDDDPGAVHLGAWKHEEVSWGIRVPGLPGSLVGACSLFQQHCDRVNVPWQEGDDLRLRVMGTLPEARGMGAGAALVRAAAEEALRQGRSMVWCDAREVAFGFYERMGFVFLNDMYHIPDIGPHRTMALDVSLAAQSKI